MNWKLIIVGCLILTLLFTIITVSVLSSFQLQNNNSAHVQKIQAGISGADTYSRSSSQQRKSPAEDPPLIDQNRDYTIPYKLPPTPQDEELWFDEITKSSRLRPPGNSSHNFGINSISSNASGGSPGRRLHIDSGNFRVQLATIWDPHPSYRFHAFSKDWRIDLVPNSNFFVPGLRITEHNEAGNESSRYVNEYSGCFYNGVVNGDDKSSVAVSLCHGMTGHIRTSDGSYFIEPVGEWKGPHTPIQHVIYKLPPMRNAHQNDVLHLPIPQTPKPLPDRSLEAEGQGEKRKRRSQQRVKRSMSRERYVELMVAADTTMATYHGSNLRHYILTLLSIVAMVYRDASIGNPINIALVNLHILKAKDFARKSTNSSSGLSASDMLRNFCKWQRDINELDDESPRHHDTALLLTRETICRNPWLGKCDTLGLAELGTMCDHYASCALVQDNGLSAAFTIAHELGHVMNMPHDDDLKCQSFQTSQGNKTRGGGEHYVMSRMLDHNTYPWAWSKCSRHYLTEFLDAGHGSCLEDKPLVENLINDDETRSNPNKQPGEIFNEHKQCQLVFGHESKLCSYMPVCRRLWCTTGDSDVDGCRTQHMPWADGTPCGESKWCLKGACVLKDLETLRTVDGGWGSWGDFGTCSRPCGGGVRRSLRECDNPPPSNGGRYCTGPRVRYESCNTHECENDLKDYRAEQCSQYNYDNFNIQGLPKDVQWVPKYTGISPRDRCKLFCRVMGSSAYYLLKEKVIDGTTCGPDTFDICVNGACLPAGCDRRLHSTKALDICGVCGGDGSTCHTESGFYNESSYGYSTVVRIPSGASSIDIRQISSTTRDDNYLALLDPSTNEYLLNGHFVVSMFRKNVHASGTILEYSGSDSTTERVNSSRPIQSDLVVQVLSVGKLTNPNVYYQFVVSRNTSSHQQSAGRFSWRINSYNCSSPCYGVVTPQYECYREHAIVNSRYCSHLTYPTLKAKYCNSHCKYTWKLHTSSDCILNTDCGSGYKNLIFKCNMVYNNGSSEIVADGKCTAESKPNTKEPCVVQCDAPKWKYGAWGECDVICGDGWQMRTAVCSFQSQMVDPYYCGNVSSGGYMVADGEDKGIVTTISGKKITIKRKCNERECGQWKIDQWSPCSRPCGEGYSRAAYACYLHSQIISPNFCLNSARPVVERKCDLPPCQWTLGSYTCDQCGVNTTRKLECIVSGTGQVTEDEHCGDQLKPSAHLYCGDCVLPENAKLVADEARINAASSTALRLTVDYGEWVYGEYSGCIRRTDTDGQSYIRTREVTCTKQNCDRVAKPATLVECGHWSTGKWSECNATCGRGHEVRTVSCIFQTQPTLNENCPPPAPPGSRECVKSADCEWKVGPWSKCSKVCGQGVRLRQVVCDTKNCIGDQPADRETCNAEPCPLWVTGDWSNCSSSCGGGVQERSVRCVDWDYNPVSENRCSNLLKPNTSEPCAEWDCGEINAVDDRYAYRWSVGTWSNCTKKCGKGFKTRNITCSKINYSSGRVISTTVAADFHCKGPKPRVKRGCARFPCSFKWITTPWSDCSRECGYGIQERTVSCHRVNQYGWIDPDPLHSCNDDEKPKNYNYCFLGDCQDLYRWKVEAWTPCSTRCGKITRQKRRVYCINKKTSGRVSATHCKEDLKPNRKRKCPFVPCGLTSCAGLPDGNTVLVVAGKNLTVYCHHGMEYIDLHSEDNYSEVYEKRLIRPETCPRGGSRLDSCECIVDRNRKSGFTYYDKIRLNVTNLRVLADNHEFTRQLMGSPINFGEAGDCYSSINCPQGRFSINLNETGFSVSPETVWISHGHRASMWIHKSKDSNVVAGRCGGYCGSCSPHRLTGIKLHVQ